MRTRAGESSESTGRAATQRRPRAGAVILGAAISIAAASCALAQDKIEFSEMIDDLVTANHILYHQGVLDGFGHVSIRDPRNPSRFLMSRALAPGLVTPGDIMEFDFDGKPSEQKGREVYSERFIHAEIYRARPDVHAVVHSHSPTVIPFSVTQVPLRPVATTASFLHAGVPVFEIRNVAGMTDMLVRNSALGKALAATLRAGPVVLLRGHGNAVVGPDVRRVVSRAIYTEVNSRLQLQALALGGPIAYISAEEGTMMEEGRNTNRMGSGRRQDRTWEMWKQEATRKSAPGSR
jgi:ribulose-5-phosphate 4-epimerase/fuculose-1-phosphate aldolase